VAIAQAMLPYVLTIADYGVEEAVAACSDLRRGLYTLRGRRP
jgi:alanine dehydrogenase